MVLLIAVFLVATAVYFRLLQKSLWQLPYHELKRRARHGTKDVVATYHVRAYGEEALLLLLILSFLPASVACVLFVSQLDGRLAWLAVFVLLVGLFGWLPFARVRLPAVLVKWGCRFLEVTLRQLRSVLTPLASLTKKRLRFNTGSELYEKADLLALLDRQKDQSDSRILHDELDIAKAALVFGDKLIRNHMVPRRIVQAVRDDEQVGPILMDELHKSGHSRFPVYDHAAADSIVGMLYMRDLVTVKDNQTVRQAMRPEVYYVQEDLTLDHALQAFLRTKHHMFMVVNNFAEVTGIITIEDVLEQVIGRSIMDEFDKYDDLRAVATLQAKEHRKKIGGKVVE